MISKLIMNNVACYKKPATLETEKKVNLIYGLNGSGKSTISNFCYKNTDSKFKDCKLEGLSDSDLLVYNQAFIQENFFESENIKGIFTLSKQNKEAEQEIANATKEIQKHQADKMLKNQNLEKAILDLNAKMEGAKNKVWVIKTTYTGGDRVLEFCLEGLKGDRARLMEYIESLSKPVTKPSKTIEQIKEEAQALTGDQAQKYQRIVIPSIILSETETHNIFQKQIVGNQNSSIAEFITRIGNSDWVKVGLKYIPTSIEANETCPFCQEKTISQTIVEEIRGYFDESYESDLKEIKRLKILYDTQVANLPAVNNLDSNPILKKYKKEYELAHSGLLNLVIQNKALIDQKLATPSAPVSLIDSKTALKAVLDVLQKVNIDIDGHNRKIDNKAVALKAIHDDFWALMRWEHDSTIATLQQDKLNGNQQIMVIKNNLNQIDQEIIRLQKKIVDQQKNTVNIEEAINNINGALIELGIDEFSIRKFNDTLYTIARPNTQTKTFQTLSEGEKMIISFLYFIELCRGKKNATDPGKNKIVMIDDPISSLSHVYIFNVGRLIHHEFLLSDKYDQVFILTHSLYFFYELTDIKKDRRDQNQELFRLRKNSSGTEILKMKYEEIQNDYHAYWMIIKDSQQAPALIANSMRNIIEYFYGFVEKRDLNTVFQKPELRHNKFDAFCRYVNRESHSLGQNIFDIKEFNYDVFKEAFGLVFKETGYVDHYKKMMGN